jgi:hypothetical protein
MTLLDLQGMDTSPDHSIIIGSAQTNICSATSFFAC